MSILDKLDNSWVDVRSSMKKTNEKRVIVDLVRRINNIISSNDDDLLWVSLPNSYSLSSLENIIDRIYDKFIGLLSDIPHIVYLSPIYITEHDSGTYRLISIAVKAEDNLRVMDGLRIINALIRIFDKFFVTIPTLIHFHWKRQPYGVHEFDISLVKFLSSVDVLNNFSYSMNNEIHDLCQKIIRRPIYSYLWSHLSYRLSERAKMRNQHINTQMKKISR